MIYFLARNPETAQISADQVEGIETVMSLPELEDVSESGQGNIITLFYFEF